MVANPGHLAFLAVFVGIPTPEDENEDDEEKSDFDKP